MKLLTNFSSEADRLLNLIFPKNIYCMCCGDAIEPSRLDSLCFSCREKINWINYNPYENMMEDFCFDELLACCTWGYYPRKIINRFKKGARYLEEPLGRLMAERLILSDVKADAIVYVPSDREKEKHIRGYNPAKLLAKRISVLCSIPVFYCLVKLAPTKSSRSSSRLEREINIYDVYDIDRKLLYKKGEAEPLRGLSVILVDDIVTTGSTADSIARLLKDNGASRVTVLAFACGNGKYF